MSTIKQKKTNQQNTQNLKKKSKMLFHLEKRKSLHEFFLIKSGKKT